MSCRSPRSLLLLGLFALAIGLLGLPESSYGKTPRINTDRLLEEARQLASQGEREKAREICRTILGKKPEHDDARLLLGQLHAWDRQYDPAREELLHVLGRNPDYRDARLALIDVELWSDQPDQALLYIEEGLSEHPEDEDLLHKKSLALEKIEQLKEAGRVNKIAVEGTYSFFDNIEDWQEGFVEYTRKTKIGAFVGRANYARRFEQSGFQFEAEAYPKIGRYLYTYLNFAYSPNGIFPRFRYGGELYGNLPKGFELSAGATRLDFSSTAVNVFTASIGKYWGNYWFAFRPYVTPRPNRIHTSYNFLARRYLGDRDHYIGLAAGFGFAASEIGTTQELDRTNSLKFQLEGRVPMNRRLTFRWGVEYNRETLPLGQERNRIALKTGIEAPF